MKLIILCSNGATEVEDEEISKEVEEILNKICKNPEEESELEDLDDAESKSEDSEEEELEMDSDEEVIDLMCQLSRDGMK